MNRPLSIGRNRTEAGRTNSVVAFCTMNITTIRYDTTIGYKEHDQDRGSVTNVYNEATELRKMSFGNSMYSDT